MGRVSYPRLIPHIFMACLGSVLNGTALNSTIFPYCPSTRKKSAVKHSSCIPPAPIAHSGLSKFPAVTKPSKIALAKLAEIKNLLDSCLSARVVVNGNVHGKMLMYVNSHGGGSCG